MNAEIFWIIIAIIIVGLAFIFTAKERKVKERQRELLREQALKRNGKIKNGSFFKTFPKLVLSHSGYDIVIYLKEKEEVGVFTYAESLFKLSQDIKIVFHVRTTLDKLFKQDIQLGNPEFDDTFFIKGNKKYFVRNFFTPEVQRKLLIFKEKYPNLRITQSKLVLEIFSNPRNTEDYDNFIDTTLSLFESLQNLGHTKLMVLL
jgi:hypothetical protein